MKRLFIFLILIAFSVNISAATFEPKSFHPGKSSYRWADKRLSKMTLDEKLGQMIHVGVNAKYLNQDNAAFAELKRQVTDNHVGGIIVFVGGVYDTVHLMNRMQEAAKIPLLISSDLESGVAMRFEDTINFPWNMAVAATGMPDFARREGAIAAREARALGIQWNFAPVVDVNNNPANPVINVRSYGEDPIEVGKFATAFMEGLQSGNVLATAKHFPGHGDTAVDSHRGLPVIDFSRERLEKTEFIPFRELIANGVGSVMISHISMPQLDSTEAKPLLRSAKPAYADSEVITEAATIPATLSEPIVTGILKKDMKFDGLIVTDAMDMSGLTLYFEPEEAAVRAVLAGNDVLLKPSSGDAPLRGLREAVKSGRITEERIDNSVRKILAWKHKLGLSHRPFTKLESIDTVVAGKESAKLADEIAERAITLVKHDGEIIPLKSEQKVLVLCISNGEDRNFVGNTFVSSLRRNGVNAERVALDVRATEAEINTALEKIQTADVVIAGLFGRVRSGSKNSTGLPDSGARVLNAALAGNAPVIAVSFGNPYLLLDFPSIENYIVAYGDMNSLQKASADATAGKISFSGKLPITIGNYARGTGISLKR